MARNFHRKQALGALNDLNVTPLMDLAFSLLIIFMVSAPLLEQTIDINLPTKPPAESVKNAEVEFQVINVDKGGQIYWGKQEVSFAQLKQLLASYASNPNPNPISLRVDRDLNPPNYPAIQLFIDILDEITANKLTKISISAKSE
ncbi:MAG: biopolymer transporter ExbD [Opitutales bacterium]|nr:biopolymer transporter ExbD [Opitutales bacterium]